MLIKYSEQLAPNVEIHGGLLLSTRNDDLVEVDGSITVIDTLITDVVSSSDSALIFAQNISQLAITRSRFLYCASVQPTPVLISFVESLTATFLNSSFIAHTK